MESPGFIRVEKWKRPHGAVAVWDAHDLGEDEHGRWFHSPLGSVHHLKDAKTWVVPWHGVQLVPTGTWWVAWFWDDPRGRWCAADVCTPAEVVENGYKYVDLELDVVGDPRGFRRVVDEDEFRDAVERGLISVDETMAARAGAADVESKMRARAEPFGDAAWRKLTEAVAMALPPTS